ncbi:MAG: hypothetical protein HKN50_02720 [Gammaproteobacteria bacterium]|nr:hypothetical protein [Gammaproteobacteria bacterium]
MSSHEANLEPKQLLSAVVENLNRFFYQDQRVPAKRRFQMLSQGDAIEFMQIDLGELGTVSCDLTMDTTECVGKLSFGNFRKILALMMASIMDRLENDQPVNLMRSDRGDTLFNIPGTLQTADGANVMVCGLRQILPGEATVQLMFLNPNRYAEALAKTMPEDSPKRINPGKFS